MKLIVDAADNQNFKKKLVELVFEFVSTYFVKSSSFAITNDGEKYSVTVSGRAARCNAFTEKETRQFNSSQLRRRGAIHRTPKVIFNAVTSYGSWFTLTVGVTPIAGRLKAVPRATNGLKKPPLRK